MAKHEGAYENGRNTGNSACFKAVLHEAFGQMDVIIAHHLAYVSTDTRDGVEYEMVQEIPSADCLIFDHCIAKRIWGSHWKLVLMRLAIEPVETRDQLFSNLYYHRDRLV